MIRKALLAVIFILVAISSYFIYGNYFPKIAIKNNNYTGLVYGNSSGNLANGGYFTKYKNNVFGNLNPSGQGLFKSNLKLKNLVKINGDQALYVNTDGQWIYYVNATDNMSIYKVSVDGGEKTRLSSDQVDGLNLVNGILYYIDISKKRTIYSMTTEGKDSKEIVTDLNCKNLIVKDYWIYYSIKNEIYKVSMEGKNKLQIASIRTALYSDDYSWKGNFDVEGGYVYYPGLDGKLYSVTDDGKKNTLLISGSIASINIYDSYLYYSDESTKTIYRIKLGVTSKPDYVLGGSDYYDLNIVNNDGVMFRDESVINGGFYMIEKKL